MRKEDVIRLSKGQKDEREESLQVKALKAAGNASTIYAAILVLACVFDGYILESQRVFDLMTVISMIGGVCTLNFTVRGGYEFFKMEKKNRLADFIVFGLMALGCMAKTLLFFFA